MSMQGYSAPAGSRNQSKAVGGDAKPGKVPAPSGAITLGKAPEPGVSGHKPGSAIKGFDGSVIDGKIKI